MSPTLYRIFALIAQIVAAFVAIAILKPARKEIKSAFQAGIVCAVYDFIIEAIAFKYGVWFCYGGFQILHVPVDMSVQFLFYGMMISTVSGFPALFRRWDFLKVLYGNKRHDFIHRIIFMILISVWGATGDFISKKLGIWENASWWTFYHTAFIAWLSLNVLTVFSYDLFLKKNCTV